MNKLFHLIRQAQKDESGASLVEYAVLFAVVAGGSVAALTAMGGSISTLFGAISAWVDGLAGGMGIGA